MVNQKEKCRTNEMGVNITDDDVECMTGQSLQNVSLEWADQCVSDVQNNETLFEPFQTEIVWNNYALGDCIKMCRCLHLEEYPRESFLREYHQRVCTGDHEAPFGGDFNIVNDIFQLPRSQSFSKPDEDVLLIHLRLGDKVERNWSNRNATEILLHGAQALHDHKFRHLIKSVGELLGNAKEANVSKVELVGGSHKSLMYKKSRPYQYCIQRGLEEHGFTVSMRTEGSPDEDFYYVSHAKKLVIAVGGYSRLMGQMAVANGGELFGRTFGALDYSQLELFINETTRKSSLTLQPELAINKRIWSSIVAHTNSGSTSLLHTPANTRLTVVGVVVFIGFLLRVISSLKKTSVKARREQQIGSTSCSTTITGDEVVDYEENGANSMIRKRTRRSNMTMKKRTIQIV